MKTPHREVVLSLGEGTHVQSFFQSLFPLPKELLSWFKRTVFSASIHSTGIMDFSLRRSQQADTGRCSVDRRLLRRHHRCDQLIWTKMRPVFSENCPEWRSTKYLKIIVHFYLGFRPYTASKFAETAWK